MKLLSGVRERRLHKPGFPSTRAVKLEPIDPQPLSVPVRCGGLSNPASLLPPAVVARRRVAAARQPRLGRGNVHNRKRMDDEDARSKNTGNARAARNIQGFYVSF